MKVIIDEDVCIGCEACVELCPEVFEMVDDKAIVVDGADPAAFEDKVRAAVEGCPVECISIE